MLGVYLADFYIVSKRSYKLDRLHAIPAWRASALSAWAIGAVAASMAFTGRATVTTIPNLDGVIVGAVSYLVLKRAAEMLGRPA